MNKSIFAMVIGFLGCYLFLQKENVSTLIAIVVMMWSNNISQSVYYETYYNVKK